jgi:hypothetical protein
MIAYPHEQRVVAAVDHPSRPDGREAKSPTSGIAVGAPALGSEGDAWSSICVLKP